MSNRILDLINKEMRRHAEHVLLVAKEKFPGSNPRIEMRDGHPCVVLTGREAIDAEYGGKPWVKEALRDS